MRYFLGKLESVLLDLLIGRDKFALELEQQAQGQIKRGSLYTTLQRMEEKGYLASYQKPRPNGQGSPLRYYRVTPFGVDIWEAWTHFERAFAHRASN